MSLHRTMNKDGLSDGMMRPHDRMRAPRDNWESEALPLRPVMRYSAGGTTIGVEPEARQGWRYSRSTLSLRPRDGAG
ncbi:hypothetical protein D9611_010215 [Ephemerocybe angulata]|uniref:Uncharacterized protein n=1 Tax=Ephemerocybe angulata TaxID=980116 RepID=A0A8H5B0F1_9AGAR|nr:hypothetical protein D9611_010215 [Tulosesus angulatus]